VRLAAAACCAALACVLGAAAAERPGGGADGGGTTDFKLEALMPPYETQHEEAYLCMSVPLPDRPLKLVGVEPLSRQEVVHHMLLFGARTRPAQRPLLVADFEQVAPKVLSGCQDYARRPWGGCARSALASTAPFGPASPLFTQVSESSSTLVAVMWVH